MDYETIEDAVLRNFLKGGEFGKELENESPRDVLLNAWKKCHADFGTPNCGAKFECECLVKALERGGFAVFVNDMFPEVFHEDGVRFFTADGEWDLETRICEATAASLAEHQKSEDDAERDHHDEVRRLAEEHNFSVEAVALLSKQGAISPQVYQDTMNYLQKHLSLSFEEMQERITDWVNTWGEEIIAGGVEGFVEAFVRKEVGEGEYLKLLTDIGKKHDMRLDAILEEMFERFSTRGVENILDVKEMGHTPDQGAVYTTLANAAGVWSTSETKKMLQEGLLKHMRSSGDTEIVSLGGIPPHVQAIIDRLLGKDPEETEDAEPKCTFTANDVAPGGGLLS